MPGLLLVRSSGNDHHDDWHEGDGGDADNDVNDGIAGVLGRGGGCLKPFPTSFHAPGCFFSPIYVQLSLSFTFTSVTFTFCNFHFL